MGLGGNKVKQRIPDDPRNTRWATDTSAPGFKLLSSMGWTPENASLGNAESQAAILAHSPGFSKKISSIPIAKDSFAGIGARKPGEAVGIGGLRAMGLPVGSMGFVTASQGLADGELPPPIKTGGEFGSLLARLNALAAAESTASSSEDQDDSGDTEKARKKEKKDKKKRKLQEVEEAVKVVEAAIELNANVATPPDSGTSTPTVHRNRTMAARSKHLRAKRQATVNNAAAMAEILGIAPPDSVSPSPSVTPSAPSPRPALPVNSAAGNGWPVAPARELSPETAAAVTTPFFAPASTGSLASTFAPSSSGALASTFTPAATTRLPSTIPTPSTSTFGSGLGSMFAKAASTTLESTFEEPVPSKETDKEREKREKKERKLAKKALKDAQRSSAAEEAVQAKVDSDSDGLVAAVALASSDAKAEKKSRKRSGDDAEDVDEAERKRAKKARKAEKKLGKTQVE